MTSSLRYGLIRATDLPVYDLGTDHPFARDRQKALFDLLQRIGSAEGPGHGFLSTRPATDAELHRAHSPAYTAMVEAVSVPDPGQDVLREAYRFGLGTSDNPIGVGQHQASAAISGATVSCVQAVMHGDRHHAFNSAGGLHHARADAAAGFCVYNDLVVGIHEALSLGAERVLYVDFDVHHGDGVEFAFDRDPRVMTVSFHQSPQTLYPGTGFVYDRGHGEGKGTVVNMPFAPATGDASWWRCVETVLPKLVRAFRPDLIVSQHGCDPHREDPLASLELTTRPMYDAACLTRDLAEEVCAGKWVATGGGGYQPYRVIPRAWSCVWLAMTRQDVPERVDEAWRSEWRDAAGSDLPELFFDPSPIENPSADAENERMLSELDRST